ncbi:MAG: hypothetical protein ACREBR_03310 [bacterium]
MIPTIDDFRIKLMEKFDEAKSKNEEYVVIESGLLHREIGGYPNNEGNHRMPVCCKAMTNIMNEHDKVLDSPDSIQGASLKIKYNLKFH